MAGGIWGDGPRGGIFGARIDPRLREKLERRRARQRIAEAHAAAEGMQEPSRALYEAKHRRAQGLPPETSFLEDIASLGSRAVGGAQKMWQMAPAAAGALWEDPLGTIDRAGQAGQAATDAIVRAVPQPFARFNDPRYDQIENAADLTGSVMLGSAAIPAEANALRMGIKVYHGSPHDFERFDASKIGTGEGAQAYGHGLYFAEREGVAKQYRDNLAGYKFVQDALASGKDKRPAQVAEWLYAMPNMTDEHIGQALKVLDENAPASQVRQWTEEGRKLLATSKDAGRMYEVDIAAEPEQFLDWDRPLSEQPQAIQDAMVTPEGQALSDKLDAVIVEKNALAGDRDPRTNMMRNEKRWHELAREADRLQGELSKVVTADMKGGYAQLTLGGGAESARRLREAGVPGIKYLDQGSRAAGEGSRNYVIFPGNEHLISILKKYGLPISAAGLAALHELHPEEAQAAERKDKRK